MQLRLEAAAVRLPVAFAAALRAALLASTFIGAAAGLAGAADIQNIGTLGGSQAFLGGSNNISADGTVVVGASNITGNLERHAFRWSGGVMTDIGTAAAAPIAGPTACRAMAMSLSARPRSPGTSSAMPSAGPPAAA